MGNLTVIKLGGALVGDATLVDRFWQSAALIARESQLVVVHGGGPQATALARRLGHEPRVVNGRRVTTELDLQIVQWTMRGELNSALVAAARRHHVRAVGISGVDGAIIDVIKRPPWNVGGESVDFGFVGDVEAVDPSLIRHLLEGGFVPVIAPLASDQAGTCYNVNADTVACSVAGALGAGRFVLATEAGGVRDAEGNLLRHVDRDLFSRGRDEGWIAGGMLVKLEIAFKALDEGASEVLIALPDDMIAGERATIVSST